MKITIPKDYRTYSLKFLKENHPELLKDPVHYWRAKTGIELIHQEPDLDEFKFIVENWKKMPTQWKELSDKKSIELFGKDNLSRVSEILKQYNTRRGFPRGSAAMTLKGRFGNRRFLS